MTKRTTTTFFIAVIYCLVVGLGLGGMLYVIHMQGSKLEEAKAAIAERAAKNAAYQNVMRMIDSSAPDRAELQTYFISEKNTISFISELENAAGVVGVTFQTTELSVAPASTKDGVTVPAVLSIGVHFSGSEAAVKKFITLLENVPYHKTILNFSLTSNQVANAWDAVTTLHITMTP